MSSAVTVNWRRVGALIAILIGTLALYWPATRSLAELWVNGDLTTYTHGYLIAGLSCWLAWRARAAVSEPDDGPATPRSRALIALLLLGIVLAWQFAYRAGIQIAIELLLLPLIWVSVLALLGRRAARALSFPVGYLIFAIPIWDYVNPLAHDSSVMAVQFLLRLVGIPAFFHGNFVQIPAGEFEIAHGCSGLHFIMVALAITALLGELRGDSWRGRLRWLLVGLAVAVLVNWVRVFTIILIGHFTQMQHYVVRENHYYYGWGLFAVAFVVLFLIERKVPLRTATPVAAAGRSAGGAPLPARWAAAICATLAFPCAFNAIIDARLATPRPGPLSSSSIHGWTMVEATGSDWHPVQLSADLARHLQVRRDDQQIELYVARYREQRLGKKLGGYANRLGGDASVLETGIETVAGLPFGSVLLEQDGGQALLWFTYRVDGRAFTAATPAQLWYSWLTLVTANSPESVALALWAPCKPDCGAARAALGAFVADGGAQL